MATRRRKPITSRREIARLLRRETRAVTAAFILMIREKRIVIKELEQFIYQNDFNGILRQIEITPRDADLLVEALRRVALAGGNAELGINLNTTRAADWLRELSGRLITNFNLHSLETVRELLALNASLGRSPRTTALDLVGRVNAYGAREGGFIGLNAPQSRAVLNARRNLTSGDPEQMRYYLQNERRDRRYDAAVLKYINAEKPLPAALLNKVLTRYEARLLQTRGETIARTETVVALNFGRTESMRQASEELEDGARIVKIWESGPDDGRQREQHTAANGQRVEMDEPFRMENGDLLMFPGDPSLGASAENIINCRCGVLYEVVKE